MSNLFNPFLVKSLLFVPAINDAFLEKTLGLSGDDKPDGIIFDLEDSVNIDSKRDAREKLSKFLSKHKEIKGEYKIGIRINGYKTKWVKEDTKLVRALQPDFVVIPKTEGAREVRKLRKWCKAKQLLIIIETIEGLNNAQKITQEFTKTDFAMCGYEDASADLMIERSSDLSKLTPLTFFLMQFIQICRSQKVILFDGPSRKFSSESDLSLLRQECEYTNQFNFAGKAAIHPNQVSIINKIYNKERLRAKASEVIEQMEKAIAGSSVTTNSENEMIDTPSYKMYKKIIDLLS